MALTTLSPGGIIRSAELNANFSGLANGSNMTTPTIAGATLTSPIFSGTSTGTMTISGAITMVNPIIDSAGATTAGAQGYDKNNKALLVGDGTASQSIYTSAWKSFTPSWTNLTPGSGTNTGAYCVIGKTVHFRARFQFGSGSSVGTIPTMTLPVTANASSAGFQPIANVIIEDSGTTLYYAIMLGTGGIYLQDASATYLKYANLTATTPMTWTTNDMIYIIGAYEAA